MLPSSTVNDILTKAFSPRRYAGFYAGISLFLFLSVALLPASALSAGNQYLSELLGRADEKQLYAERYWEVLLHYKHGLTGYRSLVDDPRFFLAPTGKKDMRAEMKATLAAFFEPGGGDAHPRCRFPGRYRWLDEQLDIDESRLPPVNCGEFETAVSKIKPRSAVLVFPTAYMNGPGSMFGHTLLRIDSEYESKLLSYAATYAAHTNRNDGPLYAIKGVFGYYPGYFSILPYYEKVKEYSDLEHRDMWEYRMNLSEEEVTRILLHLWELKDIYSDYYFFDENCSYDLLFLLESARPSLRLTDRMKTWVIPVDTIRAVQDAGLVERVDYRPSRGTKIRHVNSLLNGDGQESAFRLATGAMAAAELKGQDTEEKIKALDLATEYLQYRYGKHQLGKEAYQKEFLALLSARSRLGTPESDIYRIPAPERPENGHSPGRFSIGAGVSEGEAFQEIRLRPANHELSDPDHGYLEGSQIVFMGVSVRHDDDDGVRLQYLDIVDIVSISARDRFFQPISWKVKGGIYRETFADGEEHLAYRLNSGGGFAYKSDLSGLYYGMIEADLAVSGEFDHDFALGIGPSIGMIRKLSDFWTLNLSAGVMYYELGDLHRSYRASAEQVFRINRNSSVNLLVSEKKEFNDERAEVAIYWNFYF